MVLEDIPCEQLATTIQMTTRGTAVNDVYFLAFLVFLATLLARLAIGLAGAGLPEALASFRAYQNKVNFSVRHKKEMNLSQK